MLADGSTSVSISSVNGPFGGCGMVSWSGVATITVGCAASAPSSLSDTSDKPSPSSTSGAAGACGLGLSASVARTLVCVGCSETSSATVSTSQSGGR